MGREPLTPYRREPREFRRVLAPRLETLRVPLRAVPLLERVLVEPRRAVARRPAARRTVDLLPERVARTGLPRFLVAAALRADAERCAAVRLRAAFFAAAFTRGRRRATFALLPEPPFIPPPVALFTVAQARAAAVSSDTPRSS